MIKIVHLGIPVTKSNSYFFKRRTVWIPQHIADYEAQLKNTASITMTKLGLPPLKGPVSMTIVYYLNSKRRKDLPNLPKTTCDALNGIVYEDDNQIVHQVMYKYLDLQNPRVEIFIEEASLPSNDMAWPLTRTEEEPPEPKKSSKKKTKTK